MTISALSEGTFSASAATSTVANDTIAFAIALLLSDGSTSPDARPLSGKSVCMCAACSTLCVTQRT